MCDCDSRRGHQKIITAVKNAFLCSPLTDRGGKKRMKLYDEKNGGSKTHVTRDVKKLICQCPYLQSLKFTSLSSSMVRKNLGK